MNGAQALFKALTDAGLDTCFANPGTSEMQLVYEMGRTKNARAILCLEKNVVTGAADGYARMAGKPAFALLHVGSGFANGIANLHNAGRAYTAIVNEEFHQQFEAAMKTKGPKLIEARIVQNLKPAIDAVHKPRGVSGRPYTAVWKKPLGACRRNPLEHDLDVFWPTSDGGLSCDRRS